MQSDANEVPINSSQSCEEWKDLELDRIPQFDLLNCFEKLSINQFYMIESNFTCFDDYSYWRCFILLIT